jgi:SMI1/KNR4 family protein SUKH-1
MGPMRGTVLAILFLLGLFVVLPISILWLRDKIFHTSRKRIPEQIQGQIHAYRARLVNPQQALVEAEIGAFLPQRLIAMYADRELVLSQNLNICPPGKDPKKSSECIDDFLPLDSESQKFTCDLELLANSKGFCFAGDGCGNFYWVPVSDTRQADAPVFFACHDPWGNEKVAESLDQFLCWPRRARSDQ